MVGPSVPPWTRRPLLSEGLHKQQHHNSIPQLPSNNVHLITHPILNITIRALKKELHQCASTHLVKEKGAH